MSIKDFRNEIKGKMGSSDYYKICTSYLKSQPDLKKQISLNDYLDFPIALWSKTAYYYEKEKISKMENSQYAVVKDASDWQLLAIFSKEASYNIAHNYLRQKNDSHVFGSGPTWCISTQNAERYWNQYTGGKDYPIVFMLLSKHNSLERYAIVFNNISQGQKNKNIEYSKENFEKGYTIADMNGEIRDFSQKIGSRDEVIKLIEKYFNVTFSTPINEEKEGRVNISKIIYDCFDGVKTLADKQKDAFINPEMEKVLSFVRDKTFLQDFKEIKDFKENYNLKYGKDYHKDTFDIFYKTTLAFSSFKSLVEKYSKEDFAYLMYSCFLICILDVNRNFPVRSFLSKFNDDTFKKAMKDAITLLKKGVYPKMLNVIMSNPHIQRNGIKFIDDLLNSKNNEDKNHPLYKLLSLIDTEGLMKSVMSSLPGQVVFNMMRTAEMSKWFKVFGSRETDRYFIENFISKRYGARKNGKIFVRNHDKSNYDYFDKYFVGLNVQDFKSNFFTPIISIVINRDTEMRDKSHVIGLLDEIYGKIIDLSQNNRYAEMKNWDELEDELLIDENKAKKLPIEELILKIDEAINSIIKHFDKQGFDLVTRTLEKRYEMLIFKKR